ncbi:MAG: type II toxin-antitoxin system VapC family toxin [Bacteroidales bacterium]|nr:type II toxin-antitoxin system VapC family toxin [Bacteroidales bacterium]
MYLLDTNICIYIINKRPLQVVEKIKIFKPSQIKISVVTVAELEYGASKSQNRQKNRIAILIFLSGFDILFFDDNDAEIYGEIRADLEKKGKVIGAYDMQIAAQALAKDLILVSNNVKEFSRIENLKLENWA